MSRKSCPRCGERAFERLESYAHCPHCLYVEDYWQDSEGTYYDALKVLSDLGLSLIDETKEEIKSIEEKQSA